MRNLEFVFWFLVCFRYLRLVIHTISYFLLYKVTTIPSQPSYDASDCTVILPTIDPCNPEFKECLHTILMSSPAATIIVTVGKTNKNICKSEARKLRSAYPGTQILLLTTKVANKRRQVCAAIPLVQTRITILADDHVFWPSPIFIPTVLAPFEDPQVGCVGTNKKVRRDLSESGLRSFFNFLGCVYLERHNFELRATNAIDGGVFVVSGRTAIIRSEILQNPAFLEGFSNEKFFFGMFGPLNADDDNFITRWLVKNNWKIKFQHCKDATMETTLGTYPKFLSQCLRWVRTTWRSNSASLFTDRTVWYRQPWCVYAVYITSFFNFALFYDATLMYTLYNSSFGNDWSLVSAMVAWIFFSKMVKLIPHFLKHPADLAFIPGYLAFAYFHSLLKLYALLTFWVTAWGGRDLAACEKADEVVDGGEDVQVIQGDAYPESWSDAGSSMGSSDVRPYYHSETSSRSSSVISSPRSTASSWTDYSPPLTKYSRVVETPWGGVKRANMSFQPVNVLERQIPLQRLGKQVKADDASSVLSDASSTSGSSIWSSESTSARGRVQMKDFCRARQGKQRREIEANQMMGAKRYISMAGGLGRWT